MTQPKPKIRLYVPQDYLTGAALLLSGNQAHYLANVMRVKECEAIAVFNGHDGTWRAEVASVSKKSISVLLKSQITPQRSCPDLWLTFAPIKHHMERMVEKAVELGVSKLLPVITQHSVVRSVNEEKLLAHAIEAAEQCERDDVPALESYKDIGTLLAAWPSDRILLHADESGGGENLTTLLPQLAEKKYGIFIGPEGGFSADEKRMLKSVAQVKAFGMGPRILRADTAAIAALACVQCYAGDWDKKPRFETKE